MKKHSLNTKGFGVVEALLVLVVLVVIVGGGAYIYHRDHKAKTPISTSTTAKTTPQTGKANTANKPAATTDVYAGWKTYTLGSTGLTIKYPADWTAANAAAQCDGSQGYTISPPESELGAVSVASVNEALTSYEVGFTVEPKQPANANCAPSGSLEGVPVGSLGNSQAITGGALSGKYFLVTGTQADGASQAFVVNNDYGPNQTINESGFTTVNGVSIRAGATFMAGQDIGDADVSSFVNSQLYKDTINILDSLSAN